MPASPTYRPFRRLSATAALLAALLILAQAGCSYLGLAPGESSMDLDERTVFGATLSTGDELVLDMRNPGSGGYDFAGASFDPAVLQLLRHHLVPPEESMPGNFGRAVYAFRALAPGRTDVIIRIHRPWEKNTLPEIYKTVHVTVE